MAEPLPRWRRGFNHLERAAAPRLEELFHSEDFHDALAVATKAKQDARRAGEAFSRGLWHRLNLPTNSDVTRLLGEIGRLQVEVRRLGLELELERKQNGTDRDGSIKHN